MPFAIRKAGDTYEVVTKGTGKVHGKFKNKRAAVGQLRALYANVPESRQ